MQNLLKDKGVKLILFGWVGFITENLVVTHNRDLIIQYTGGEKNYRYIYSFFSSAATLSIAYGYFRFARGKGPQLLQSISKYRLAAGFAFQCLGLCGFSQALPGLQLPIDKNNNWEARCPFDFKSYNSKGSIQGVKRVSRHDLLWSLATLGLGSSIVTPFLGEFIMFAMPLAFAIIGGCHQDYRYRRGSGGLLTPEIDQISSNIPFVAFINGNQSFKVLAEEIQWNNMAIACIIAFAFHSRRYKKLKKLGFI